jgi:hypothetical protein
LGADSVQSGHRDHLVTVAQRGYSFGLLAVYSAKFAPEAMNTFAKCYAGLRAASSVGAQWQCS